MSKRRERKRERSGEMGERERGGREGEEKSGREREGERVSK